MKSAQTSHLEYYDKKLRFDPRFVDDDYMFADRLPRKTTHAERMVAKGYIKLMPQRLDPYLIPMWVLSI